MTENCTEECKKFQQPCAENSCKYWLDYPKELNCTFVTVEKNGTLTLREIAERMGISFVRVKQIEDRAIKRIKDNKQSIYLQEEC